MPQETGRRLTSGESHERDLIGEVSEGSVVAFGQLYDRFCSRAYGVAYSVCRDEASAHEAVQDTFVYVWTNRASCHREPGTVAAWLLTMVRCRAIDLARRNRDHVSDAAPDNRLDEGSGHQKVDVSLVERDAAGRLQALAGLPDEQQEVIALACYGQLSHTEIATQLRLAPGTVKGRMRLGLRQLRESLDQARNPLLNSPASLETRS